MHSESEASTMHGAVETSAIHGAVEKRFRTYLLIFKLILILNSMAEKYRKRSRQDHDSILALVSIREEIMNLLLVQYSAHSSPQ
jgi:hypothetical protein